MPKLVMAKNNRTDSLIACLIYLSSLNNHLPLTFSLLNNDSPMTSEQHAYQRMNQLKGGPKMFETRMKNVVAVAFVLIVTVISGAAQDRSRPDSQPAAPAQSDLIGKKAIDFALNDLDGNKVELQSF